MEDYMSYSSDFHDDLIAIYAYPHCGRVINVDRWLEDPDPSKFFFVDMVTTWLYHNDNQALLTLLDYIEYKKDYRMKAKDANGTTLVISHSQRVVELAYFTTSGPEPFSIIIKYAVEGEYGVWYPVSYSNSVTGECVTEEDQVDELASQCAAEILLDRGLKRVGSGGKITMSAPLTAAETRGKNKRATFQVQERVRRLMESARRFTEAPQPPVSKKVGKYVTPSTIQPVDRFGSTPASVHVDTSASPATSPQANNKTLGRSARNQNGTGKRPRKHPTALEDDDDSLGDEGSVMHIDEEVHEEAAEEVPATLFERIQNWQQNTIPPSVAGIPVAREDTTAPESDVPVQLHQGRKEQRMVVEEEDGEGGIRKPSPPLVKKKPTATGTPPANRITYKSSFGDFARNLKDKANKQDGRDKSHPSTSGKDDTSGGYLGKARARDEIPGKPLYKQSAYLMKNPSFSALMKFDGDSGDDSGEAAESRAGSGDENAYRTSSKPIIPLQSFGPDPPQSANKPLPHRLPVRPLPSPSASRPESARPGAGGALLISVSPSAVTTLKDAITIILKNHSLDTNRLFEDCDRHRTFHFYYFGPSGHDISIRRTDREITASQPRTPERLLSTQRYIYLTRIFFQIGTTLQPPTNRGRIAKSQIFVEYTSWQVFQFGKWVPRTLMRKDKRGENEIVDDKKVVERHGLRWGKWALEMKPWERKDKVSITGGSY
ncbi:hypothetical protein K402DRAFT_419002 [Aulographum hederae CBS 113979]|uniref:Uncharacterized protein n=1 Tax=Aulographum hederae CBS 113979 TaxID=1176131 RepID=A0A6G1H7I3_9PEZI|nr:hypothetical protein K402DRAFT_419002 [Aulographum hederae CBS 113979]